MKIKCVKNEMTFLALFPYVNIWLEEGKVFLISIGILNYNINFFLDK